MNRTFRFAGALFGLFLVFALFSMPAYAEPSDKNIVSRAPKVDNVELNYLTAGHGPAVILLHGYAETSRMWRPIIPVLAEKFTVTAGSSWDRRLVDSSGQDRHDNFRESDPRACALVRDREGESGRP